MPFPTTDWPTSYDPIEDRTDAVDIVAADDFDYQDNQVRQLQSWLGTTGKLIGEDVAGAGPSGLASPEADGGIAHTLAARNAFTTGKLLSAGDAFDAVYVEKLFLSAAGRLWAKDGVDINDSEFLRIPVGGTLPVTFDSGRLFYKTGASEGLKVADGAAWGDVGGGGAQAEQYIVGNAPNGDTAAICNYLDTGNGAQLKQAIDDAKDTGGEVYIRPGVYDFSQPGGPTTVVEVRRCKVRGSSNVYSPSPGVEIRTRTDTTLSLFYVNNALLSDLNITVQTPTAPCVGTYIVRNTGICERVVVDFSSPSWSPGQISDGGIDSVFYQTTPIAQLIDCSVGRSAFAPAFDPTAPGNYLACVRAAHTDSTDPSYVYGGRLHGGDYGIYVDGARVNVLDVKTYRASLNAVAVVGAAWGRIAGSHLATRLTPPSSHGVVIDAASSRWDISGNVFGDIRTGTDALNVGGSYCTIRGNRSLFRGINLLVSSSNNILVANRMPIPLVDAGTGNLDLDAGIAGADPNAIHVNASGEIAGVAAKTTPIAGDLLVIEDSGAANVKKSLQIGDISHTLLDDIGSNSHSQIDSHLSSILNPHSVTKSQVSLGNVTDDAQLKRAGNDWSGFGEITSPASDDILLMEDTDDSGNKKRVQITNLPSTDSDAIHDNVSGEISIVTEKTVPVTTDVLLMEDSAATYAKKRVQIGNLPGYGSVSYGGHEEDIPPGAPSAKDDEFAGASLDPKWVWLNSGAPAGGGESYGVANGRFYAVLDPDTPAFGDQHTMAQTVPAQNFEFYAKVSCQRFVNFHSVGIGLFATSKYANMWLGHRAAYGEFTGLVQEYDTGFIDHYTWPVPNDYGIFKIFHNITTKLTNFSFTVDGFTYTQLFSKTLTWTPTHFGIDMLAYNASVGMVCNAYWFRVNLL